jgi:hypothetical protein
MRISIVFTSLFALFAITTTCIPAQALPLTSHAKPIGVEAALDPVEYYGQGYDDDCYRPRRRYYSDGYYEKPYRHYRKKRYYGSYYYPKRYSEKRYYRRDYGYHGYGY